MPLSNFAVSIVSQAQGANRQLAVSVDLKKPSGQLIAMPFDPAQPSQLWFPVLRWLDGIGLFRMPGLALVNVLTGMAMYSAGRDGSPVLPVPVGQIGVGSIWNIVAGPPYVCTRLLNDVNQNLRIDGGSPYVGQGIVTNGWNGGAPYELWTYVQTNAPYPSAFDHIPYSRLLAVVNSQTGYNLSSNGQSGDTSQLTIQAQDSNNAAQQFTVPWTFDANSGMPNGMALINQASGNAMHVDGDRQGATVSQMAYPPLDNECRWGFGIGSFSPFQFNSFWLLPTAQDGGQRLNIPGNGPYTPGQGLITWDGGGPNSNWQILQAYPGYREAVAPSPSPNPPDPGPIFFTAGDQASDDAAQ